MIALSFAISRLWAGLLSAIPFQQAKIHFVNQRHCITDQRLSGSVEKCLRDFSLAVNVSITLRYPGLFRHWICPTQIS